MPWLSSKVDDVGHGFRYRFFNSSANLNTGGPTGHYNDVKAWCAQEFEGPPVYGGRWYHGDQSIWLRDQADAAAFRLRWG